MPGKKDPEYFPLNLNMSGVGSFFVDGGHHHGKYEGGGNGTTALSEFVNLSGMPPVNSDEEDEEDDELDLDRDGSESVSSVQGSDLDVDVDVVDTLVMSIRDKLRMGGGGQHNYPRDFWTDVVPNSSPNTNSNANSDFSSDSSMMMMMNENLLHNSHHRHVTMSGSGSASNNSSSSSSIAGSSSGGRRRRIHPYSHSNSHSHSHWRRHSTNNYHLRSHHHVHHGSIQKTKSSCQNHWWTSKSYNDISKRGGKNSTDSGTNDDPYQLLQELIESGDLIKEAVRRLNKKCFTSSNSTNTHTNNTSSNNHSSNNSSNTNNKKLFTFRDEDTENSYPLHSVFPLSAP